MGDRFRFVLVFVFGDDDIDEADDSDDNDTGEPYLCGFCVPGAVNKVEILDCGV